MAKYVDTDKIIPTFTGWVDDVKKEYPDAYACAYVFTMKKIVEMLEKAETADVQPVVHGKWIREESPYNDITYRCSSCSRDWWADNWSRWNYCPNCGARMDGNKEDEND